MTLRELNALPGAAARGEFLRCCGSTRWADAVVARRPFRDIATLLRGADEAWWALDRADWLEAFSQHPRIGARSFGWSSEEQAGMRGVSQRTRAALLRGNREYEQRFGHVFLICATGKSAAEILSQLEARLTNERETELRVAAGEQARITRLRLEKLLSTPEQSRAG